MPEIRSPLDNYCERRRQNVDDARYLNVRDGKKIRGRRKNDSIVRIERIESAIHETRER